MLRLRRPLGFLLATGLLFVTLTLTAQDSPFPWEQVVGVDVSELDESQRTAVIELADEIPNYFGCRGTVTECVSEDPPDPTALRLVGFLGRHVLADETPEEIEAAVAVRRRSAMPFSVADIYIDEAVCLGADDPLVTVVEFADFECPICQTTSPILELIVLERSENVRLCFKFFPTRSHERAVPSCVAALAASRQDQFWEMHDALFASAPDLSDEAIETCASGIGLEMAQFRQDIADEALLEEVLADKLEAQELGVDRTPSIFINGKRYLGALSEMELADRIDEELEMVQ